MESDKSSNTCRHLAPAGQRARTRGSALLTRTGALQQAGRMLRQSQRFPPPPKTPVWDGTHDGTSVCAQAAIDGFVDLINVHESVDFQYI